MAIGVARKRPRLNGEWALHAPPSCSLPVSHAGGPHVASFVVGRLCVRGACVRAGVARRAANRKRKECRPKRGRSPKQEKGFVRTARLGYPKPVLFLRACDGSCSCDYSIQILYISPQQMGAFTRSLAGLYPRVTRSLADFTHGEPAGRIATARLGASAMASFN